MSDDTFSASDFTSAETSLSSDAPASAAPVEASAPVETAAQPGEATTQPAAIETTSPSTEPAKPAGPIPFDVHKTALENARIKATQEALAQFDQQYGWAKQVDRGELEHALTVARKLNVGAGPEAFISGLQELLTDGQRDPQIAAALRSFQGKALAQLRQQQAQPDQEPQFLLESADGSVRFDPQAFQQWKQWNEQRVHDPRAAKWRRRAIRTPRSERRLSQGGVADAPHGQPAAVLNDINRQAAASTVNPRRPAHGHRSRWTRCPSRKRCSTSLRNSA
jgi:hypothetical protein